MHENLQDPMVQQLIALAKATPLNRRQVLAGLGIGATSLALAACAPATSAPVAAPDTSESDSTLVWANWLDYLDRDAGGNYPTLNAFTAQSAIDVRYTTTIVDNESFYASIKDQLSSGQPTEADTFVLTDWMLARLIRFGYLQPLDRGKIPNISNLDPVLAASEFDSGRAMSLPWQSGITGVGWNSDLVPAGLGSVFDLWNPKHAGKVTVPSDWRDTIGLIMLSQSVDISSTAWGIDQFAVAVAELAVQVKAGQLLGVRGHEYIKDFRSGEAVAGIVYASDMMRLNDEVGYEKFHFVIPSTGAVTFTDSFVVPLGSPRKANAEKLMDYYYQPEVAAEVVASVRSVSPVVGAQAAAAAKFPDIAENPLIFPDAATRAAMHTFRAVQAVEQQQFSAAFRDATVGA